MQWQGKIEFKKPITINGKPHGVEHETTLPIFVPEDVGRVVHAEDTGILWFATSTTWEELTPGGIGEHNHNDLYYTETELDGMFEGKNGEKQIVDWTNINSKPSTYPPQAHTHDQYLEEVDFTYLDNNGVTGTGATNIALGNHLHDDRYSLDGHTHEASTITYDNTDSSLSATVMKDAIDELDGVIETLAFDADEIAYSNTTSELAATDTQAAVDETIALMKQTSDIYVDGKRTDTYTATGSISHPYKTMAEAIAVATSGQVIKVGAGVYTDSFTLPDGVSLVGGGLVSTVFYGGDVVTGSVGGIRLEGFSFTGTLTVNAISSGTNIYGDEAVLTLNNDFMAFNVSIENTTTTPVIIAAGISTISVGKIVAADTTTVSQTGGDVTINKVNISNSSSSTTIVSTGGIFRATSMSAVNSGGGNSIELDNGATFTQSNNLVDVMYAGPIDTGSAYTAIEGVHDITGSMNKPFGTNHIVRPSEQIGYDNGDSGLIAENVKDAIDELTTNIGFTPLTSGQPLDTPAIGTTRFDGTANTLYIYGDTGWVSTSLV